MDEQNKPPAWLIPSKVYDVLKWIGLIVCPALATLTLTVGNAVSIPCTAEIATCITAAGTFVGAIIGASALKGGVSDDVED
jgi:hypothetical protein